jgi:pyruvate-formate lyase
VADSLAAVKKIVFEDQKASLGEVLAALNIDFEGQEVLRAKLKAAPKFGNDDDYVDDMFGELSVWLQHRIGMEKNPFGSSLWAGRSGAVAHVEFGKKVGALPDGRKAGEPLADGYLSPSQGVDVNGPTAVFNSASKVDHNENSFAALMNMKFDRKVINTHDKMVKLGTMVASFFRRGGFHIQINILDRQTLLDAQVRPEEHKNLMVRVAGYSAYYVNLPRLLQDEILARSDEAM